MPKTQRAPDRPEVAVAHMLLCVIGASSGMRFFGPEESPVMVDRIESQIATDKPTDLKLTANWLQGVARLGLGRPPNCAGEGRQGGP